MVARIGLWETLDIVEERLRPREAVRELVADGKLTRTQADAWLAELREDAAAGRLVAGVCGFVVSGNRP